MSARRLFVLFVCCAIGAWLLLRPPPPATWAAAAAGQKITALNGFVEFKPAAQQTGQGCTVQLTGTWSATITFQAANSDDDATLTTITGMRADTGATSSTATTNTFWVLPAGYNRYRATATAYTSGTIEAWFQPAMTGPPGSIFGSGAAATADVNVKQINGVTPLMGAGNTGTGSHRVTIASDQAVIPVNLQLGGVAVSAGTGVVGTGTVRVTLATDVALPAGTNVIGALSANQSVNVAQINGVAATMGNGVSGTGVQRVTIASDSTGTVAVTYATTGNGTAAGAIRVSIASDSTGTVAMTYATTGSGTATGALRVELANNGTGVVGLNAGTNLIGKAGIDQTTPGTTNAVSLAQIGATTVLSGNGVAGAGAQRVTIASDSTGQIIALGAAASGATPSGNPVYQGVRSHTALPTAVADAQVVAPLADKYGRLVVLPFGIRDLHSHATTTISASTAETTVLASVASTFLDLTCVWVANTSGTGVRVDFKDSTAGTIRFSLYCPATATTGFVPPMPIAQTTAANNWTATSSASVTDLRIYVQAIQNK